MDFGILNEVCISNLDTCGPAGGAVAFWIRPHPYEWGFRIVLLARTATGLRISGTGNKFRLGKLSFCGV